MTDDDARKCRDECVREADEGLHAAEALAAAGHYGRARSLDLLAFETIIQAVAYHWVLMGWATFDRSRARETLFIERSALENHPLKQLLIAFIEPVVRLSARDVVGHLERGEDPGIGPERAIEQMRTEAQQEPLPVRELNRLKNEGLYPSGGRAGRQGPSEISREDYEEFHSRILRRVALLRGLMRTELSEEGIQSVGRNGRLLAARGFRLDKAFLFKLRKAQGESGLSVYDFLERRFDEERSLHG